MSTTDDWQDARRELLEEGRRRVGPPPEFETVEALLRGELPEPEAQRVREVLAYYPELVRVVTATEPETQEPVLTGAEREADLARLRERLGIESATVVPMRPGAQRFRMLAAAAGVVIALVLVGLWMRRDTDALRPTEARVLVADVERNTRGSGAREVVLFTSSDYTLKPIHTPRRDHARYALELFKVEEDGSDSVWKRDDVQRRSDGSFPVELSTARLEPGRYQLILYGINAAPEPLATYSLRIEEP